MPSEDDDCGGQPLWYSVLIFCCKGMIECIIVVLFMWLLIQVLFTNHLEVHLQILLGVGLVVFCLSLILGCVLCWRRTTPKHSDDTEDGASPAPPPADDPVTLAASPSVSSQATSIRVQYEELEGDVLDYPSAFGSSTPSDDDFNAMSLELTKQSKSCFPLRRLSSPSLSSPNYRPMATGRSSLPTFPKLGLLAKTQKALKRHCTVSGDTRPNSDNIRLTTARPGSPCAPSATDTRGQFVEKPLLPEYEDSCSEDPGPSLHFTLTFSPAQQTITISLLSLTGTEHRLGGVWVQASLPPLCPGPFEVLSQHHSLTPDHRKSLVLEVRTLEELQSCTLRFAVFTKEINAAKASLLGTLEVQCERIDWISDRPIAYTGPLRQTVDNMQRATVLSESAVLFPGLDISTGSQP